MALSHIGEDKKKILEWLFLNIENTPVAYLPAITVYKYAKKTLGLNSISRRDFELFERTVVCPSQILKDSHSAGKKTLSYFAHGPNLLWQADLVDLHRPKGQKGR